MTTNRNSPRLACIPGHSRCLNCCARPLSREATGQLGVRFGPVQSALTIESTTPVQPRAILSWLYPPPPMASMRPWQKSSAICRRLAAAWAWAAGLNSMLVIGSPRILSAPHCNRMNSGSIFAQVSLYLRPDLVEHRVVGERRHRDVELGADSAGPVPVSCANPVPGYSVRPSW